MYTGKKSPFLFEIQNICCEVCTDLVKRNYCHFEKVAPNKYALSFLIEINRQLPAATEVAFTIDVRPKGGQKAVKFVNLRLKVCDALASLKTNPMLMMILREMLQNSNLPLSCLLKPVSWITITIKLNQIWLLFIDLVLLLEYFVQHF